MAHEPSFVDDITAILIRNKIIDQKEQTAIHDAFKKRSPERFDYFLLDEGLVEAEDLLAALSEYYQVPSFDVVDYLFERRLLHLFPKDFLLRHAIIPAELEDEVLIVVAANPRNQNLLEEIGAFVSYDIRYNVGLHRDICDAVKEFYDRSLTEDELVETGDQEAEFDEPYEFEVREEGAVVDEEDE